MEHEIYEEDDFFDYQESEDKGKKNPDDPDFFHFPGYLRGASENIGGNFRKEFGGEGIYTFKGNIGISQEFGIQEGKECEEEERGKDRVIGEDTAFVQPVFFEELLQCAPQAYEDVIFF